MQLDMLCFLLLRRVLFTCEVWPWLARLRARRKSNTNRGTMGRAPVWNLMFLRLTGLKRRHAMLSLILRRVS